MMENTFERLPQKVENNRCFRDKVYCVLDYMGDKVKAQNRWKQLRSRFTRIFC